MKAPQQKKDKGFINFFLKQLHSLVLNFLLCFGLFAGQVPMVHADDVLDGITEAAESTGSSSSDAATSNATVTASSGDGSSSGEGYTKIEGKNVDPKSKLLLGNVALFAATMAAPILIMKCKEAISVWIYGASAALYLANEVGLFTRFKNASDAEMAAYLGRGDEDKQIDSLESAAEQTDKAKKAAERRAMIAKIAAAGFAAATAMALVENYTDWVKAGQCGGQAASGTYLERPVKEEIFTIAEINFNTIPDKTNNFDFMMAMEEQIAFLNGSAQSVSLDEYNQRKEQSADSLESLPSIKTALMKLTQLSLTFLSSKAIAGDDKKSGGINWAGSGMKALTGMLGAGAGVIAASSTKIAESPMVKNPLTRAALFGGMSAFAIGSAKESSDAASKLGERSSEYRRLATTLRQQVDSNTTTTNSSTRTLVSSTTSDADGKSASSNDSEVCFTGKSTTTMNLDESCACTGNNTCKQANVPDVSAMPEFAGQSILSDSLKSLKSAGDSLYSGRLEGASTAADALGKNAARISKLRDSLVDKINKDNLAAGGKGNYDLEKLEGKFQDQLLKNVNDSFKQLSPAQQASLASFAPALGSDSETKEKEGKADDTTPAVGGTGAIAIGDPGSKSNSGASWDFNFEEGKEENAMDAEAQALADAMAKEDENYLIEGDINDDRNKDIFKIITGRYLKSAYPVIFEEE